MEGMACLTDTLSNRIRPTDIFSTVRLLMLKKTYDSESGSASVFRWERE